MGSKIRFPFFMSRRYLFSKKKVGAINIVSGISVMGVAFGTAALLCTLAVFSGLRDLIGTLYTAFDPPIQVVPAQGKFADSADPVLRRVQTHPAVAAASFCLEDNAMILFQGRPVVFMLKGVDDRFAEVTGVKNILYGNGTYCLHRAGVDYGVPGIGLAEALGGMNYGSLQVCVPRKGEHINLSSPAESINTGDLVAPGICFNVNQRKYDENYMLASLGFAQELFEQPGKVTSLEIKLRSGADVQYVKQELQAMTGSRYKVLDQLEQQSEMYKVMNIEKVMTYIFLTFILLIACFNIVGSVSMLMIDKREDVRTLRHLGASRRMIYKIFLYEGRIISLLGAVIGTLLGLGLCLLQQEFGLLKLGGSSGSFIVDSYPVSINAGDVLLVFFTVVVVGLLSVWYAVRYLSRRLL